MIVLHAAALVDVVLDREDAAWLLDQLAGQRVCSPAHQPAEVVSALARLHRAGLLDADTRDGALAEARALEQELVLVLPTLLTSAAPWSSTRASGCSTDCTWRLPKNGPPPSSPATGGWPTAGLPATSAVRGSASNAAPDLRQRTGSLLPAQVPGAHSPRSSSRAASCASSKRAE